MSRTRKRQYTRSKRWDKTCRNHGACSWCSRGRQHRHKRAMPAPDKGETLYGVEDNYNSASQDEDLNLHESNYCPVRTARKQVAGKGVKYKEEDATYRPSGDEWVEERLKMARDTVHREWKGLPIVVYPKGMQNEIDQTAKKHDDNYTSKPSLLKRIINYLKSCLTT